MFKSIFLWYNIFMDKKYLLIQKILSRLDGGVADLWKIYKLMYFIDFEYYKTYKKSISGCKYYNWQYGPLPYNTTQYAIENMIERGEENGLWGKVGPANVQINYSNLLNSNFSTEEELVFDSILNKYGRLSGAELVAISHEDMPWKMTKKGEEIDYDYVMWRDSEETVITDITQKVFA